MDIKSRFLHIMFVFYERYGYLDENGNAIMELPVKRGELAEMVGARPETISRLIDKLQIDDVLQFKDRRVQFSNVNEVLQQVGSTV
jgi:CRP-like cAMP-binding protein